MHEKTSIWEFMYETKKIAKPIRLIECFAGIGSQYRALQNVFKDKVESYKIVEWAYNSIVAYNNIHLKDKTDYSKDLTKEELISKIKGISTNYNTPLTPDQLNKKPLVWLQKAYNNIKATHNLIDIMQVKGEDLEIVDKDKYEYILTYSFPCQDLSLAGHGKGMDLSQADGGTRSGLLWEIKRILEELKAKDSLPQILLMENVPMLISKNHIHNFKKWDNFLTSLGYKNYTECLNAKDYGIPQNRNRCFMISLLGDYNYTFPRKQKLNIKLKDMLEEKVDEKYYLTPKQIVDIQNWKAYEKQLEQLEKTDKKQVSPTITTRTCDYTSSMILVKMRTEKEKNLFTEDGNIKRYMHSDIIDKFEDGQMATLTYPNGYGHGPRTHNESIALNTIDKPCVKYNQRIRKLTPKETTRLMGFKDKDYNSMKQDLSDMAIYHCCGDSIVVNVLEHIFKQMKGE